MIKFNKFFLSQNFISNIYLKNKLIILIHVKMWYEINREKIKIIIVNTYIDLYDFEEYNISSELMSWIN